MGKVKQFLSLLAAGIFLVSSVPQPVYADELATSGTSASIEVSSSGNAASSASVTGSTEANNSAATGSDVDNHNSSNSGSGSTLATEGVKSPAASSGSDASLAGSSASSASSNSASSGSSMAASASSSEDLVDHEISEENDGHNFTISGNIPADAVLSVKKNDGKNVIKTIEDAAADETDVTVYYAYDISIISDGKEWEPEDHEETVSVSITDLKLPDKDDADEIQVNHISDDGDVETVPAEVSDDSVTFTADSFSTYTVNGITYTYEDNWYTDWRYTLDSTAKTITLKYYERSVSDVFVPATAVVNGVTYHTQLTTNGSTMFRAYNQNIAFEKGVKAVGDCSYMFSSTSAMSLDLSTLDTSEMTDTSYMFDDCEKLEDINLSNFNTSNVTNMKRMFSMCYKLTKVDLSNFNTSNVTNMNSMFSNDTAMTDIDLSSFDTTNVTDMAYMFAYDKLIESLDVSGFKTNNVTDMSGVFIHCELVSSLDLHNFITSNVTSMRDMFCSCSSLVAIDVSSFDTANVTDMSYMFYGYGKNKMIDVLDLSGFDTSKVTDMSYMLANCQIDKLIFGENFTTSNVPSSSLITERTICYTVVTKGTGLGLSMFYASKYKNTGGVVTNGIAKNLADTFIRQNEVTSTFTFEVPDSLELVDSGLNNDDYTATLNVTFSNPTNGYVVYNSVSDRIGLKTVGNNSKVGIDHVIYSSYEAGSMTYTDSNGKVTTAVVSCDESKISSDATSYKYTESIDLHADLDPAIVGKYTGSITISVGNISH